MLLILKNFQAFNFFVGLPFFANLTVFVFHLFCTICHLDHDPLQLFHLYLSDLLDGIFIVLFFSFVMLTPFLKKHIPNMPHICFRFFTKLKRFNRTFIWFFSEGIDESWKFGPWGIIAFVILIGKFFPLHFFFVLGYRGLFLLDFAEKMFSILLFFKDNSHSLFLCFFLPLNLIESFLFFAPGFFLFSPLFFFSLSFAFFFFFEFKKLFFSKFRSSFGSHFESVV